MRRALAAMAVALVVTTCSGDPYPLPSGAPTTLVRSSVAIGQPRSQVLVYLNVRPGDRIDLLGADAVAFTVLTDGQEVRLDGATVRFLLSRPVIEANGDHVIGKNFEDLAGAIVTAASASPGPDNTVGIAAELTPERAGRFKITNVRLRYRLNGGGEQIGEGIDVIWIVCADDPVPADCPERPGA